MNEPVKKRGRPRAFDPNVALAEAGKTFLHHGYSGASLETLSKAMKLNKPSLYAAFGDKHALFMLVLRERARMVTTRYKAAFDKGRTLEESLRYFFDEAVEVSLGEGGPPGCPIAAAESTEALVDEEVGAFTKRFRAASDKGMAQWIRNKIAREGPVSAESLARVTTGTLHDIALRARIGESRTKLRELGHDAAKVLALAAGESV